MTICPGPVARLTQPPGAKARTRRRRRPGSHGGKTSGIVDNAVDWPFNVGAPDRVCLTVMPRFAGLTDDVDLHFRRVAARSMPRRQTTGLVLQDFLMAVWRRKPKSKALIHSDQGAQFTVTDRAAFQRARNLEHSMSRRENCRDNAAAESFLNLLKRERQLSGRRIAAS